MGKKTDAEHPGEFALIAEIFAPLAKADQNSFGLTDDAALLSPISGKELVVTADMMIAGVHFFPDDEAGLVARKLLRVNLSDLAAKGAVPHGYILTIALPKEVTMAWLRAFAAGLAADQAEYRINLLGGDTTSGPGPLCLSLTAMGWVDRGLMPRRSGARGGDDIYVTGTIGDAALGLQVRRDRGWGNLSRQASKDLLQRYLLPQPRVALGLRLPGRIHASIDISDGLAADLGHILETSDKGAEIETARIPLSIAARQALEAGMTDMPQLLSGGDDYEILFTAPLEHRQSLMEAADQCGVRLSRIGRITPSGGAVFLDEKGHPLALARAGYQHF
jgi:thiamine-monophosphate kinase